MTDVPERVFVHPRDIATGEVGSQQQTQTDTEYVRADIQRAREERYDARIDALVAERDAARETGALLRRHLDDARRELQRKHERAEAAEQRERDARAEIEQLREEQNAAIKEAVEGDRQIRRATEWIERADWLDVQADRMDWIAMQRKDTESVGEALAYEDACRDLARRIRTGDGP